MDNNEKIVFKIKFRNKTSATNSQFRTSLSSNHSRKFLPIIDHSEMYNRYQDIIHIAKIKSPLEISRSSNKESPKNKMINSNVHKIPHLYRKKNIKIIKKINKAQLSKKDKYQTFKVFLETKDNLRKIMEYNLLKTSEFILPDYKNSRKLDKYNNLTTILKHSPKFQRLNYSKRSSQRLRTIHRSFALDNPFIYRSFEKTFYKIKNHCTIDNPALKSIQNNYPYLPLSNLN